MDSLFKTKSGTIMLGGVEYSTYPPPRALMKVMEFCWAKQFVAVGAMRFCSLDYYRQWENVVLGDPHDGESMFHLEGNPCTGGSLNEVYAWCASLPVITPDRIKVIAQHGKYNCLVRISDPSILIQRVRSALLVAEPMLALNCSEATYNRGIEVDKEILNSQKFHFTIFQKAQKFADDKEYRLAIIDTRTSSVHKDYIDLQIGDCSDILNIEDLPNYP